METEEIVIASKNERKGHLFWRRVFAVFLDALVLGIIGYIATIFFKEQFIALAEFGPLVGLVITTIYLGVFDSNIGGGQTIGKRIVRIKVVNEEGEKIELANSLLRGFILASMYCCVVKNSSVIWNVYLGLIGTFQLASVIFFLKCYKQHQSLHDLICKTYVIDAADNEVEAAPKMQRRTVILLFASIFAVCVLLSIVMTSIVSSIVTESFNSNIGQDSFDNLRKEIKEINHPDIMNVVLQNVSWNDGVKDHKGLVIHLFVKNDDNFDQIAKEVGNCAAKFVEYKKGNFLTINITSGYNIGIVHMSTSDSYEIWDENGVEKQ